MLNVGSVFNASLSFLLLLAAILAASVRSDVLERVGARRLQEVSLRLQENEVSVS